MLPPAPVIRIRLPNSSFEIPTSSVSTGRRPNKSSSLMWEMSPSLTAPPIISDVVGITRNETLSTSQRRSRSRSRFDSAAAIATTSVVAPVFRTTSSRLKLSPTTRIPCTRRPSFRGSSSIIATGMKLAEGVLIICRIICSPLSPAP